MFEDLYALIQTGRRRCQCILVPIDYSHLKGIVSMAANFRLHGIITALVTPFSSVGLVDEEALSQLVQFQLERNVNGFFPLGTTGMGPAMDPDQRKRVAEVVVEETKGRVPVIVQVGASDPAASLELARHAEKIGAEAIASLTPFYYHPGEDAIIDYYRKLSQATRLPLFVYNIPRHTGNNVDASLLLKLSKIPNVVGIKDSSQDFSQLLSYLEAVPDGFNVINGTDSYLFSAFCAGVGGGVSATANPFPELFVDMYEAYMAGNIEKGRALQIKIHSVRDVLSQPPLAPLLEALRFRGLKSGFVKPPLRSMGAGEIENLRESLSRILPEIKLAA
jgi:4-hydroxy-tetrahydrodipicolinate synthase